jgi:hypothetical protein
LRRRNKWKKSDTLPSTGPHSIVGFGIRGAGLWVPLPEPTGTIYNQQAVNDIPTIL